MRSRAVTLAAIALVATLSASVRADNDDGLLPPPPPKRKAGELTLLYMAGIGWGGSIGVFADSLQYTSRPAASADPGVFVALFTAGAGCLLPTVVDVAFDKRPGAAQTVTSSMVLALGESIALNEYFSNRASTSFHTYTKDASWIFGGTTAGLATGLTLAALVHTTPGRAAWVETTGLFAGAFAASVAGAIARPPNSLAPYSGESIRDVGLSGAIAGAAGIAVGLSTATLLSPSVLRAHVIDLGWMLPTAISVVACAKCPAADTFTAAAIAGGVGFVATFLGTMTLPQVGLSSVRPPAGITVMPYAVPISTGGFEIGLGGSL